LTNSEFRNKFAPTFVLGTELSIALQRAINSAPVAAIGTPTEFYRIRTGRVMSKRKNI
jgi:hypothetical protein